MKMSLIANQEGNRRKLNNQFLGFSIIPNTGRNWTSEQYSEKLKRNVERTIRVFSLDEVMSSSECLEDSYNPRSRRIAFLLEV